MNIKEMIEVMQAFEDGKKIEYSVVGNNNWQPTASEPAWAWDRCDYRIAPEPEPKKEGRWERVEIRVDDGDYVLSSKRNGWWRVACLQNIAGFGGIDYRSPFDDAFIVRSMTPILFSSDNGYVTFSSGATLRPGIPVAAWFWKEEK